MTIREDPVNNATEAQCVHNIDMETLSSHGELRYKQFIVPVSAEAFVILQTQRHSFREMFLRFNPDSATHVQELESCLRPGERYDVQLLAVYLLIEICGPSDDVAMDLKYPL